MSASLRTIPALAGAALALLLGGCQSTTDPAEGGFLSGVSALNTGAYEQRIEDKEAELAAARAEQEALDGEAAELDAQQASVSADVAETERRLAALERDIEELDREFLEASQRQQIEQQELERLRAEIDELENARQLLAADPVVDAQTKRRRIEELERRREVLEETLGAALAN